MRMNKLVALFIIAIIVSPNLTIVRGQTMTLAPFDAEYEPGEDVSISGTSAATANLTLIIMFNSTTLYEANFTVEGDGNYTEEYGIPEDASDGVYTVTVSDGGESVNADFSVASDDSREFAETFINQAEDAMDNVEGAFDDLEEEGIEIPPEANSSYLQGVEYLSLAVENFDEGNYTGASDNAFEAIQLFGDAFERVQGLTPVEPVDIDDGDDGDDETGDPDSLATAIERAYAYWMRLNDTVTRLDEEGFNVTIVVEALEDVKGHLDTASAYQEEGNHTAAVREFREARKSLGRIHGFIESRIKDRKEKQTEQFLEQFQRRVDKITGVLEGLQVSLKAGQTQRVQAVLRSTAQRLLRLSDSIAGGDLEDVLDDMEDAVDELEDGLDELNGAGLSSQIKSANRFEAKIESLIRSLMMLSEKGFNTSEIDDEIAHAYDLLGEIEDKLREGDEESAEEILETVEELIDKIQKSIREQSTQNRNSFGESLSGGRIGADDDGKDDDDDVVDDDDDTIGMETEPSDSTSDDIAGELESIINRVEEKLGELNTTNVNATDVEHLIEEAKAIMEEAKALSEENPDEAEELLEKAEEVVEEIIDLLEDMNEPVVNTGMTTVREPDDDDGEEEDDENDVGSTNPELPDEQPDDVESNG